MTTCLSLDRTLGRRRETRLCSYSWPLGCGLPKLLAKQRARHTRLYFFSVAKSQSFGDGSFRIPHRAEPVSTAPVPLSHKAKPTQRRAEFARMTIAAPTAPQRGLQGRERQSFALHLNWDCRQQRGQPLVLWRQSFARGLGLGARPKCL